MGRRTKRSLSRAVAARKANLTRRLKKIQSSIVNTETEVTEEDVKMEVEEIPDPGGDRDSNSLKNGTPSILERIKMKATGRSEKEPPLVKPRSRHHCLFCYEGLEGGRSTKISELEGTFTAMFILKKMLSVPNGKLKSYLKITEYPNKWLVFCEKCEPLVEEAVSLQKEIGRLEQDLRRCQETMINRIKVTWREKEEMLTSLSSWIAHQTRKECVNSEKCKVKPLKSGIKRRKVSIEVPPVPAPPVPVIESPPEKAVASVPVIIPKICAPRKQVLRQRICGDEEETQFYFEGGEAEAVSPEGSHSGVADLPSDVPVPVPGKVIIDLAEAKALNDGNFNCDLCPSSPPMSAYRLANHLMFHYSRPLKCVQCSLHYSSADDCASRQSAKRFGEGPHHQCAFEDLTSVKHPPSTSPFWRCHSCSEMFSSDTERDLHQNSVHPYDLGTFPPKNYQCSTCVTSSYRNLAEWRLHRALEHPSVAAMSCYYCDATFSSKTKDGLEFFDEEAMQTHVQKEHNLLRKTPSNLLRLPSDCLLCGAAFSTTKGETGLNHHMKNCHGLSHNQSFNCPVPTCLVKGKCKKMIRYHLEARHMSREEDTSICDLCGFSASNIKQLEDHKLTEHSVMPESRKVYQCSKEECSFQCLKKCQMDRHLMKEHGAERKHKCQFCGKGFLNAKHCREHEEIHQNAGLKPYQCEICGNSFAIRNYLYIHKRLSHQNRPFASTHKKKPPRKKTFTCGQPKNLNGDWGGNA